MANASIGSLLDDTGRFEARLAKYYAAIRDATPDNDVKLLTYYLSRHRRDLIAVLSGLPARDLARARKIRLPDDLAFAPVDAFGALERSPAKVKGLDLLKSVVRYRQPLLNRYRRVLVLPLSPRAKAVVRSLVRLEQQNLGIPEEMLTSNYF